MGFLPLQPITIPITRFPLCRRSLLFLLGIFKIADVKMLQVLYTFITLLPSVYPHVNICSYLTCWPNSFFMASLSSAVLIWPSPFVSNCQRRRIIPLKNGTLFLQIKFMIQIKIKCIIFSGTSKPISRIKQFQIISAILRYSLWISKKALKGCE